ncbi:hypothetical protein ACHAWU_001450 [Discostella pseudostelligera]|uniref:RNA helicase n=1 Tax=Discostella pseudostelligera TaxID=259834 RepID=A0ABD3M762_9STRA
MMFHQHAKCLYFRALEARVAVRIGPHARNLGVIASTTPTSPHHHPSYCRRIKVTPTQQYFSSLPMQNFKDHENQHDSDHGAQASKQDRQQLHEGGFNRAANRKEMTRRRILAEELMRFFATNDDCFNMTLRELNINKTWGSDTGLSEYRSFYLDSLSSFGTMLAENGDAEWSGISAANILDQFAGCGEFSDNPQLYSKIYRSMAAMMQREVEDRLALEKLQKSHEQKLQELRMELLESESLALDLTSEGANFNELDMIEEELSRSLSQRALISESRKARKEINKRRNTLDKIRSDATKLKRLISRIESEFDEIEWPMPKHEFQAVTEKLLKVAALVAPALAEFVTHRHEDFDKYRKLEMQTDLTKPHEWYPRARLDKRRIIFHAGPTNSGKTYNALQRLKQANNGMYLAPLRLLAAEIYENLNAEGIYIDLLTGQERRVVPFATHRSSTVELACLDKDYDVVVIDEIQMLCDEFRGFAWTRALLGVRCKEVHLCGGAEAIEIVKKIANMCGDDFELHRYERFGYV